MSTDVWIAIGTCVSAAGTITIIIITLTMARGKMKKYVDTQVKAIQRATLDEAQTIVTNKIQSLKDELAAQQKEDAVANTIQAHDQQLKSLKETMDSLRQHQH